MENYMKSIKSDPTNARVHDDANQTAIKQSLKDLGAGRSILMDSDNVLIAGNGVYEQAQNLGLPVRVIESDGTELIAIKRTDLKTDDDKRKALAIADNKTSDLSIFDDDKLQELFSSMEDFKESSGFDTAEIEKLMEKATLEDNNDQAEEEKPEIEFTEELLEKHNYLVLYFDNEIDWLQAKTLFDIKTVHSLNSRPGYEKKGIGRVINGAKALNVIIQGEQQP
jgi:hypothetical protein